MRMHVQRWFERVVFAGVVPPPLVVGEAVELRYALVIAVEQVVVQLVDVLQFVLRGGRELGFGHVGLRVFHFRHRGVQDQFV